MQNVIISNQHYIYISNMEKIPTSFELMGHEYKVILENDIYITEGIYGECDVDRKVLRIQKPKEFKTIKKDKSESTPINITVDDSVETYYHELVHMILGVIGENKLYSNEKFVTMFSKCLHQIEKTKKYDKQSRKR